MFCFMYDYFVNKSYEMGFRNLPQAAIPERPVLAWEPPANG